MLAKAKTMGDLNLAPWEFAADPRVMLILSQAAQAYSLCYVIYTYIKTLYASFWIGWFIRLCMEIHSISQKYMIFL